MVSTPLPVNFRHVSSLLAFGSTRSFPYSSGPNSDIRCITARLIR